MPKINLNDDDKIRLIEAMNNDIEPSSDLLPKLFPGTAEKFDVVKLDRAKVPTLEYAGKRSKAAILAEASAGSGPLEIERCFGCKSPEVEDDYKEWRNLIVQGDNLQFLKTCYKNEDPLVKDKVKGKVDLIYIDPPFGTGDEYGGSEGAKSYSAKIQGGQFIEDLRERIILSRELLTKTGIFMIRIDYHFGHYIKVLCDEILLGSSSFVNEIIIKRGRNVAGASAKLEVDNDFILVYAANLTKDSLNGVLSKRPVANIQWTGFTMAGDRNPPERVFLGKKIFPKKGQHFSLIQPKVDKLQNEYFIRLKCGGCGCYYYNDDDDYSLSNNMKKKNNRFKFYDILSTTLFHGCKNINTCFECSGKDFKVEYLGSDNKKISNIWTDIESYSKSHKYPTENSEELLQRIIELATDENAFVLDFFGGSGTTAAVAEKLNRRWISCDFGKHAIYTQQRRILRINESKALKEEKNKEGKVVVKKGSQYKHEPKPFCVTSVGSYDFSHVMSLREHKDRYIDFVLGLFQLSRDNKSTQAYKMVNIFADKDKSPVEIYPVWQDEYLKDIRIDEDYLQSIVDQVGLKLSGDYYIIAPETCSNISETTLKNGSNKITFHILSFPYKVLEDASRHFELHDQPSSEDEVNQLVSSTAFYFNEDIEISVERNKTGFEITNFKTDILNKDGEPFQGLDGIAMILVDQDYEPNKPFDMDETIFSKDIKEGKVKIKLTKSVAIIAIDKHGNESKPTKI